MEKSLSCFTKNSKGKNGLQAQCRECRSIFIKQWRESNKEHRADYRKQYTAENKDKKAVWDKTYREAHAGHIKESKRRWCQDNKQRLRIKNKEWLKKNPGIRAAMRARYRANKKKATPTWAEHSMIRTVYKKARDYAGEVDHIVPLQSEIVCGLHVWANLQILPPSMNASKGNYYWPDMPEEFL